MTGLAGVLALAAAVALVLVFVVGRSSPPAAQTASSLTGTCLSAKAVPLTIVVGERSNVPQVQIPSELTSLVTTAAQNRQPISLIRIDGQPRVFNLGLLNTHGDVSTGAVEHDLNGYVGGVVNELDGSLLRAVATQANVLKAMSLAAAATPPGGNIIVIDSGLQTTGQLTYQTPGTLMAPPGDVVQFLRQEKAIPGLGGRNVLLSGFGYAAAPQPALDQAETANVAAQWKAIAVAGGACVTVDPTPNTNAELSGLPAVATVPLPAPLVFNSCGSVVLGNEGSVGFNDGKYTFRDQAMALATLDKLAAVLKRGTEPITLIGSTSTEGGNTANYTLSRQRAVAVATILEQDGVSGGRIAIQADGSHYPGRVRDIGPDGKLLLPEAEEDREVIVQLPKCQ